MLIDDFISAAAGGSPGDVPMFWWQGWTSRYYLTSVMQLKDLDCREPGVFVVVRREGDNACTPLFAGAAVSISDDIYDDYGDCLLRSIKAGADEIHVNLMVGSPQEAAAMVEDLTLGWRLANIAARPRPSTARAFEIV